LTSRTKDAGNSGAVADTARRLQSRHVFLRRMYSA
jgi:hypothetical protein